MGQETQLKIPCSGVCFNVIAEKLLSTSQSPDTSPANSPWVAAGSCCGHRNPSRNGITNDPPQIIVNARLLLWKTLTSDDYLLKSQLSFKREKILPAPCQTPFRYLRTCAPEIPAGITRCDKVWGTPWAHSQTEKQQLLTCSSWWSRGRWQRSADPPWAPWLPSQPQTWHCPSCHLPGHTGHNHHMGHSRGEEKEQSSPEWGLWSAQGSHRRRKAQGSCPYHTAAPPRGSSSVPGQRTPHHCSCTTGPRSGEGQETETRLCLNEEVQGSCTTGVNSASALRGSSCPTEPGVSILLQMPSGVSCQGKMITPAQQESFLWEQAAVSLSNSSFLPSWKVPRDTGSAQDT